ncbi:MAG: flagellar biosynthesis protein FlhB [Burkholderiales bacterium]|jgi:flagellar biosynthetic protein FlhB
MSQADQDQQDKQLPASEQRIRKAREEGQVPRSRELVSGAILIGGFLLVTMAGAEGMHHLTQVVSSGLHIAPEVARDPTLAGTHVSNLVVHALYVVLPIGLLCAFAGIGGSLAVGGWNMAPNSLAPRFNRIDPLSGFGRMLSAQGLAESAKLIFIVFALAVIAAIALWSSREEIASLADMPLQQSLGTAWGRVSALIVAMLLALGLLAALDVPLQLWRNARQLRMSIDEVRREQKESDGDPHLRGKIRAQQRRMAFGQMLAKVPMADVVITNPTHYAVALSYTEDSNSAPRVVAKGADLIAQRIREIAAENGVPLLEAPPLARALYRHTELDAEVPSALYRAVAQVLAYVFQLKRARQLPNAVEPELPQVEVPDGLDPGEGRA